MSDKPETVDCLIIGAGPAGYTAAIYAARAGMNPLLYQGQQPGGQLMLTTDVENFPGYPKGIQGPEMMGDLESQAKRFGTDIRLGMVSSVDFSGETHKVVVEQSKEIFAKTVIIATGASAKWLGLDSEIRLRDAGGGVSACAVCDGYFHKNKNVVIVGAGDSAAEEASYLAKICKKVYMLVRRDEMRASKIMQARVKNAENIEILWNTETLEVVGDEMVESVRVINNQTKEEKILEDISGFFVAIGHHPNTDIFKKYIQTDDKGYIITEAKSTHTNIEGVFACGDVQDNVYRQAISAAGTGCMAALDAERYLAEKEGLAINA